MPHNNLEKLLNRRSSMDIGYDYSDLERAKRRREANLKQRERHMTGDVERDSPRHPNFTAVRKNDT